MVHVHPELDQEGHCGKARRDYVGARCDRHRALYSGLSGRRFVEHNQDDHRIEDGVFGRKGYYDKLWRNYLLVSHKLATVKDVKLTTDERRYFAEFEHACRFTEGGMADSLDRGPVPRRILHERKRLWDATMDRDQAVIDEIHRKAIGSALPDNLFTS